jgi:hypothetical protein
MEYQLPPEHLLYSAAQPEPPKLWERQKDRAARVVLKKIDGDPSCLMKLGDAVPLPYFFFRLWGERCVVISLHRSKLGEEGEVLLLFAAAPTVNPGLRAWVLHPGDWSRNPTSESCWIHFLNNGKPSTGPLGYNLNESGFKVNEYRWTNLEIYAALPDPSDQTKFTFEMVVDGTRVRCEGHLAAKRGYDGRPVLELRIIPENPDALSQSASPAK